MRKLLLLLITLSLCLPTAILAKGQEREPVIILTPDPDQRDPIISEADQFDADDVTPIRHVKKNISHHAKHIASQIYGPTSAQDHIWTLAEKLRPNDSVTVQQMIIALQQENPNAFDQKNINGLKHGQMLRVPTLDKILTILPEMAEIQVQQQNNQWHKEKINLTTKKSEPLLKVATKINSDSILTSAPILASKVAPKPLTNLQPQITKSTVQNKQEEKFQAITQSPAPLLLASNSNVNSSSALDSISLKSDIKPQSLPIMPVIKPAPKIIVLPPPEITKKISEFTPNTPLENIQNRQVTVTNDSTLQQLLATQQDLKTYKQEVNAHFQQLDQQNLTIQSQLQQLNKTVTILTQEMVAIGNKLGAKIITQESHAAVDTTHSVATMLPRSKITWWIIWAAVFLIVLLWMPSGKRKKSSANKRREPVLHVNDPELTDEYDFMNSKEAIPAKLDLARAYIDMEDYPSAKQIIQEILKKGNELERSQAQQLLRTF